jgi:hypothetical protein
MNHYKASPEEKQEKLCDATQVCIDAFLDEEVHLSQYMHHRKESSTDRESIAPACQGA